MTRAKRDLINLGKEQALQQLAFLFVDFLLCDLFGFLMGKNRRPREMP
jgi:hypothetical protein